MTLTYQAIRLLAEKGLTASDIAEIAEANAKIKTSAAIRQQRYRDKKRNERDVTRDVTPPPNEYISNPLPSATKVTEVCDKRARRLPDGWLPEKPYPAQVAELFELWPDGRLSRELDAFRDYWTSRKRDAAKLDWDKTWWNRIRDQHDRIVKENRSGSQEFRRSNGNGAHKSDGFINALREAQHLNPDDSYP